MPNVIPVITTPLTNETNKAVKQLPVKFDIPKEYNSTMLFAIAERQRVMLKAIQEDLQQLYNVNVPRFSSPLSIPQLVLLDTNNKLDLDYLLEDATILAVKDISTIKSDLANLTTLVNQHSASLTTIHNDLTQAKTDILNLQSSVSSNTNSIVNTIIPTINNHEQRITALGG